MKKLITNIGVGVIALIAIIALAGYFSQQQSQNISNVSISEIYKDIKQGNVEKVVVEQGTVTATLEETGEKKRAEKESGSTFLEALKDYGVSESTLEEVTVDVQKNTVQRTLG
ncbi:MAG: ATP-dependent metallopeptidase FtsH/Yme1/Tma family protein, partial [Candidatus Paceibacteria bacterium]